MTKRFSGGPLIAMLVIVSVLSVGVGRASADHDVEHRIAQFWQRVDALRPGDYLSARDVGQWALNVIERDARTRITVADFRASAGGLQAAFDRAGPAAVAAPTPAPTTAPAATLTVVSATAGYSTSGYYEIVGEVRNSGTVTARFVEVIATFYNASGTVIGTDFTYTQPSDLASRDVAPFKISARVSGIATYKLVVSSSRI